MPERVISTLNFVFESLVLVAPLVIPGIILAAWISASGASDRIATIFNNRISFAIVAASLIGAVSPVCGVTVLPLTASLLASGVPFVPVMAFWLSSPVTDPAMLATTAATLGWTFAFSKTFAALALGLIGGFITAALIGRSWTDRPLRQNKLVEGLQNKTYCGSDSFNFAIWTSATRRSRFIDQALATTRLILICLIPAFAAEHLLNQMLTPNSLAAYVGVDSWWSVPVAVIVGAPAYLDGFAALPLTRALLDHGMSPGAALAFLVSGGVVSVWGAMAIFPVLKLKPFLLYLASAVFGSMLAGWTFEWLA